VRRYLENKGIVYPLYPTKSQEQQLNQMVGNGRLVWNLLLAQTKEYHHYTGDFLFYQDMNRVLQDYKEVYSFLQLSNSQCLQQTLKDLDKAMKSCFESKFGFPKFKKKGLGEFFRVPQHFEVKSKSIQLPKLGCVKINKHKSLDGKPKNITVYKDRDRWFASVCVEFKPIKLPTTGKEVGLDLGTKRLVTRSTDGKYKKSFFKSKGTKKLIASIKKTQRHLAKQKKNSNSWFKTKYTLGKLNRKLANKRYDRLQKFSTKLVKGKYKNGKLIRKGYDFIAVEDLQTQRMTKSNRGTGRNVQAKAKLNSSILNEGWSEFVRMLEYKCKWYGKTLKKVDPAYTSQMCSACGYTDHKNRRSQEEFKCQVCGFELNADWNAAKNILFLAKAA